MPDNFSTDEEETRRQHRRGSTNRWEVVKSYDDTHFEGTRHTEEEEVVVIVTASELVRTVFIVITTKLIRL